MPSDRERQSDEKEVQLGAQPEITEVRVEDAADAGDGKPSEPPPENIGSKMDKGD